MPENEDNAKAEPAYRGLAIAVSFLIWAGACLVVPSMLDAGPTATTVWYVVGAVLAVIALAGGLTEAAKLTRAEFVSDFGVAVVLAALAIGSFAAADAWHPPSPLTGALKGLGLGLGAVAIHGLLDGIAKALDPDRRRTRERSQRDGTRLLAGVVALLGLMTALINLLAALGK